MDKEDLIATAEKLKQPSSGVAQEFAGKRERIVAEVNRRLAARPDLNAIIGEDNWGLAEDNTRNLGRFMESVFYEFEPNVLVETALWAFRTYRSRGFQIPFWPANLGTWVGVLGEELSEDAFKELYPFFSWLTSHIPDFARISDMQLAR